MHSLVDDAMGIVSWKAEFCYTCAAATRRRCVMGFRRRSSGGIGGGLAELEGFLMEVVAR